MTAISRAAVLTALSRHIGRENGVRADVLVHEITGVPPGPHHHSGERTLRSLITALRLEGQHICGTPESGYFIAATAAELDTTCEFLYGRALTSLAQIARMKKIAMPDLRGQMHLPT